MNNNMIDFTKLNFTSDKQRDKYILYHYLTLNYIKNNNLTQQEAEVSATNIILKYKDNLFTKNGLAVNLASNNIEFFCIYFLQDIFVPKSNNTTRNLANLHYEIWEELQKIFIDDTHDMAEFILPRGSSKSTTINKALSCYLHCFKKSRYSLIIGKRSEDAEAFVSDVRKFLEFDTIQKAFGTLVNKKDRTVNKQELELDNDTMIRAYGWETSVRGTSYSARDGIFRPTVIILDDVLNENDIKTDGAKERAVNKFYKEIKESGDESVYRNNVKIKMATKFLVLGTPLATDCFVNTIRKDVNFKVFHRRVTNIDIDDYFENNQYWINYKKIMMDTKLNEEEREQLSRQYYNDNYSDMQFPTIWEKYNCLSLAKKYLTKRTAFMQELMCDCENVGEKWFKSIRTQSTEEIEEHTFIKTMLCVDPASTTTNRSDYSAFAVGSIADNDFLYIRKGIIDKLEFNAYCEKVIELLKQYEDITHVCIEKNTFQGADVKKIQELIAKDKDLSSRRIEFINKMQRRNKDEKISTIVSPVNLGQIIFNENDVEFIEQIKEFAGQRYGNGHDDSSDTVAELYININEIQTNSYISVLDIKKLF
ncbi:hypothetical protein [Clostridium grantii]|uniref:Phage uncharacterized protein (Putative large terminase), C-terminal domain-containing protein n=1 Tax=Clostridium grantii DSM 8605 TaxID=1121316 RepID=A0A1M5SDI8_9CLOT|nr:hypothetical protein [Clostridium grantii]SHH36358.1 phage uncharacterized protein (putative large terminase), C-terminal domain-containing protein [Clostridium grantii DSM 8605]